MKESDRERMQGMRQTCDVRGSEEELGLVVGKEGRMPASLLLSKGIDLALKFGMRLDGARLACHLHATQTSPLHTLSALAGA